MASMSDPDRVGSTGVLVTVPAHARSWDRFVKSHPGRAAAHLAQYPPATRVEVAAALDRAHRCHGCGRLLRDEASRAARFGPECRRKLEPPEAKPWTVDRGGMGHLG